MARFRDDPVSAFYEELKNCTRESKFYDTPTRFILASRLLDWLREKPEDGEQSARVNIILETVYHGVEPYPGAFSIFDETMGKSDKRCWLKLFVILLQMAEDGSFARTLHRFFQADIFDTRLTHDFLSSPKLFEVIKATEVYDRATWQQAVNWFCHLAKQLLTRSAITMHHQRSMGEDTILPITAKDDLSPGGQGNISRIEVPHECVSHDLVNRLRCLRREAISDENYPDGKSEYYVFALKKIAKREDWERESNAHRALLASRTEGNVQCFGSWEVQRPDGRPEYYLLMEFSWSDLDQYFRSIPPPSFGQEIYDFWRALLSVIPALDHIHNIKISSNGSTTKLYYGWHGDIKPANILICDDGIKLTDPGWAQIKSREDVMYDEGLPIVVLSGGTSSYGGPERIDPETKKLDGSRPVTQRFDIWSLACVFLEAATWVILGIRGVDQFRTARKMAHRRPSSNENAGDDCFHDSGRLSFVVGDWIDHLQHSIRQEDQFSSQMLDIIRDEMLLERPHDRIDSKTLTRRVDSYLRAWESCMDQLPRYTFPEHLGQAFELEQKNAARDWEDPQSRSSSVAKMLDRSARFTQPRGPLMGHGHGFLPGNPRTSGQRLNIAQTPVAHTLAPRYMPAVQNLQAQWSTAAVPTPPAGSALGIVPRDLGGHLQLPPLEEKQPTFDYYAALDFLTTKRGWVYSSVLEHRERLKPQSPGPVFTNKGLAPPANDTPTRASTWSLSRTLSVRKGEHRNGYASALSDAWHNLKSASKPKKGDKGDSRGQTGSNGGQTPANTSRRVQPDTTFGDLFSERDIVILIDNSSTMAKHWPRIQDVLPLLMAMLSGQDDDGIDLYFTSSTEGYEKLMEPWQLTEPLGHKDPRSRKPGHVAQASKTQKTEKDPDDVYEVLTHILNLIGPKKKYSSKVTILILTDGVWPKTNKLTVREAISNWLRRQSTLQDGEPEAVLNDRYYSIQFVQLGEDPSGTQALVDLDDNLEHLYGVPDVIDVEPANGNVMKMIMGSLDDMWDQNDQGSGAPPSPVPEPNEGPSRLQPRHSPPGDPLQSQFLSRDKRMVTESTWDTAGQRPTWTTDPIFEEPWTQQPHRDEYVTSPTRPGPTPPQRPSPTGQGSAGPGLPHQPQAQWPYRPPPQARTPPQPQRRVIRPDLGLGYSSPPDDTPVRPNRRRTGH